MDDIKKFSDSLKRFKARELRDSHPDAFNALDDKYKVFDYLDFYEANGILFCEPNKNSINTLGNWVEVFQDGKWVRELAVQSMFPGKSS